MPRTPEITHKIMAAVKQRDTEPELILRRMLWSKGYRYRKNYRQLPGKPDIVFIRKKVAVFCDGDYWHGHNWAIRNYRSLEDELSHYSEFWRNKILGNIERDKKNTAVLKEMGWTVIRIWESDIRNDAESCIEHIKLVLDAIS